MADHPITHPSLSFVSFSGHDPDLNAKAFWTSVKNKNVFSLGQRHTDADAQPNNEHRQKRFTDGIDRFKHRINAENATRKKGELIKNYFYRVKASVNNGWPESFDTTVYVDGAAQTLERKIQTRQKLKSI